MTYAEEIKQAAINLGFDACRICAAEDSGESIRYGKWISAGYQGDMSYLERNVEKRINPLKLVEGAKSIICVALNYYPSQILPLEVPQFAYYAYGEDYHDVVRGKLYKLLEFIQSRCPSVQGRVFCDSAPVLERYWAAKSGLGFIGKNTLLIIPNKGSYFFLGELIIDLELSYDEPISNNCGKCDRCQKACPTNAFVKPYILNAKRCISYQTIENKSSEIDVAIVPLLNNNVYGCDVCQKVCPWNRYSQSNTTEEFFPKPEFLTLDLERLKKMDDEDFRFLFRKSAIKRIKFAGFQRNVKAVSESQKNYLHL